MQNTKNISASVDLNEVEKFSRIADEWWDESGKFAPLHKFNPARIGYILDKIKSHFKTETLTGLKILDIGCGGGLLCEPLARLGAVVTGIDASEKNIKVASLHAEREGLKINYINTTAEELAEKICHSGQKTVGSAVIASDRRERGDPELDCFAAARNDGDLQGKANSGGINQFDIVLNMEVIEHVADTNSFMKAAADLLKQNGLMFVATMNRTIKSYAFAIVGAEYVLRWLPKGTHDWKKFLKPSEIDAMWRQNNLELKDLKGMKYNIFKDSWAVDKDIEVNYIMFAVKN